MPFESIRSLPLMFLALALQPLVGCAGPNGESGRVIDISGGQTLVAGSSPGLEVAGGDENSGDERPKGSGRQGPDWDGDGLANEIDQCPDEPEDRDGFQDDDGCPEPDNDGDGILDVNDRCPNEPETKNGFEDEDGCPETNLNRAKQAFRDGAVAFAQADYVTARRYFEEAYNLEPRDAVLYNIAMAADKQGDRKYACMYYQKWKATPHGATSSNRIAWLENCP